MVSYSQNVRDCKAMVKELGSKELSDQMAAEAGWWQAVAKDYWNKIVILSHDPTVDNLLDELTQVLKKYER